MSDLLREPKNILSTTIRESSKCPIYKSLTTIKKRGCSKCEKVF